MDPTNSNNGKTNGIGPTAAPYAGAGPSQADPVYPYATITQPSLVEQDAHDLAQAWKRGEDIVGPEPVETYRLFYGSLLGAAATSGRLQMENQPDRWIVRVMAQSTLQLVTADFGNGDLPIIPVVGAGQRLVFKAFRRWITLTNDASLASNVYYLVIGFKGVMPANFDWL